MNESELRALIERECGPVQRISDMLWAVEVARVAMAAARLAALEESADICDQHASCEGIAERCAAAIRALAR